jgi:hypothetical protein
MKIFKDLKFKPHTDGEGLQGLMFFENGYGISVIRFKIGSLGYGSYTNNEKEWEVAVLFGNENESELCYTTPITNDVIGHLTAKQVTEIMKKIQRLNP